MVTFESIIRLCYNEDDLSEPELVSRLKAALNDPGVLSERDGNGYTLLNIAAVYGRSPDFCQVLHELDLALVKTKDNYGWLAVHSACCNVNMDTAKYLFELYPQSINIAAERFLDELEF